MQKKANNQQGSILIMILIAIVLLAIITGVVSNSGEQQKDSLDRQTRDAQVSLLINHTAALNSAILQMVMHGEDVNTIYQKLSTLKAGDDGFEDAPHKYKIYHPLGGGISYMSATSNTASEAVATNFDINLSSIITGVGKTNETIGDIIFTAKITSASYCSYINEKLLSITTVPEMSSSAFDDLFNNNAVVTIDSSNCPECVNTARLCVRNSTYNEWGFYTSLFPG